MSISFTCPCCRAHLKVRDESAVGQTIECPECEIPLLVAKSPTGEVVGQQLAPEKPAIQREAEKKGIARSNQKAKSPETKTASIPDVEPLLSLPQPAHGLRNPHVVAWSVAGAFVLGLISFLLVTDPSKMRQKDPSQSKISGVNSTTDQTGAPLEGDPSGNSDAGSDETESPLPETPEGRLAALGKQVRSRANREGHFPAGTVSGASLPVAHRWSWQAQIAAERDNPTSARIDWNQRWNDPATDRFVRHSIPRFQNPQAESQTSEDKYPASHFVGVAGVGSDAPTLPANHPRAGIFGQDRQTKIEEIGDGLSNTMLLAGVETQLGSWAEGASSYRPFTREPYLHGPDGFGTGQPKSMFVLMADGSVKEISSDTDPRIVRRMAAMNDGLPLDPKVPGEPSDTVPAKPKSIDQLPKTEGTAPKPPQVAKATVPDNHQPLPEGPPHKPATPVKPVSVAPEVAINIPAALSRKILNFDQTKPAAAYQLLLQIEELSGVRIEYDRKALGDAAERLDKPISLRMKNASLEELLNEILLQIDLERKDEKSRIQIVMPS